MVVWQSFDGVYSTSSSDLQAEPFSGSVGTDASGNISSWSFAIDTNPRAVDNETAPSELSCDAEQCADILRPVLRSIMFRSTAATVSPLPEVTLPEYGHRQSPFPSLTLRGF
jgi:hypothetical protein